MYQLKFTIKQHTPIIHFQYFLNDATLRTTELKSELDKFIIGETTGCWSGNKMERLNKVKTCNHLKGWLKHAEKPTQPAFDYDIELILNNDTIVFIDSNALAKNYKFFANKMGKEQYEEKARYKFAYFNNNLFTLVFKSPYEELLRKIDSLIAKFFLLKNFGSRQSKGFGSFYPIEKYDYLNKLSELPYFFDIDESELNANRGINITLFNIIHLFYNTLRSGINIKNQEDKTIFYFKSMMWAYAKSQNKQWDKKTIKNQYCYIKQAREDTIWTTKSNDYSNDKNQFPLGYSIHNTVTNENKDDLLLWRDLMGLSNSENAGSWRIAKINITDDKIKRFKSPLIFKPILVGDKKYRVFFGVPKYIADQFLNGEEMNTFSQILNQKFKIKFDGNGNLELSYPSTFDYQAYLKFAINTFNDSWVENTYHDMNEYKILYQIYKQLKSQVK